MPARFGLEFPAACLLACACAAVGLVGCGAGHSDAPPAATSSSARPQTVPTVPLSGQGLIVPRLSQVPPPNAATLLLQERGFNRALVPPFVLAAVNTFASAQYDYLHANYSSAKATLDGFLKLHPASDPLWSSTWSDPAGVNPYWGFPAAYAGLVCLQEIVNWRVQLSATGQSVPANPRPVILGLYMVDHSTIVEKAELAAVRPNVAFPTSLDLDPDLTANDYQFVKDSIWLFSEYLYAKSQGTLRLTILPVHYNTQLIVNYGLDAAASTPANPILAISFGADGREDLGIAPAQLDLVDLTLELYPAIPPSVFAAVNLPLVGGGGEAFYATKHTPVLSSGDEGFLTLPLETSAQVAAAPGGKVVNSVLERELGLTQWIFHEWFHGAAAAFPQFALDSPIHRWFNPAAWPSDFELTPGEAGYFNQAIDKRFLPLGMDRFETYLTPHDPRPFDLRNLTVRDFVGKYSPAPGSADSANPYFSGGTLTVPRGARPGQVLWTNDAGTTLVFTLPTDPVTGHILSLTTSDTERLILNRAPDGSFLETVQTFVLDGLHSFVPASSGAAH